MTGDKLIVGCPVKNRGWILPEWYERVEHATRNLDVEYLFVAEPSSDDTVELAEKYGEVIMLPDAGHNREHAWGKRPRLEHMVVIRNALLEGVREREPDFFLSLDSDILIPDPYVLNLKATLTMGDPKEPAKEIDAVGGLLYMDPRDPLCTSFGKKSKQHNFKRVGPNTVHKIDYIMAAKLMKPSAYNIDYVFNKRGEDIGWCDAARNAGLKLFCDGRIPAKHVMRKEMLEEVDPRVGF